MFQPNRSLHYLLLGVLTGSVGCQDSTLSLGDVLSAEIIDCGYGLRGGADTQVVSIAASESNQAALNKLRDVAAGAFPAGEWVNFGPDSSYRTIRLKCRDGQIELSSWHPLAEANPKVVAASYGLTSVVDQTREEFLQDDDPNYVRQREAFDVLQQQLVSLNAKE